MYMPLEEEYTVKLGEEEISMKLPASLEIGTVLQPGIGYVTLEEPPVIKAPVIAPAIYGQVEPLDEVWDLCINWKSNEPLMKFRLRNDLSVAPESSAIFAWDEDRSQLSLEESEMLDKGTVQIRESSDVYVKMDINMKRLRGSFVAIRRDPDINLWTLEKRD